MTRHARDLAFAALALTVCAPRLDATSCMPAYGPIELLPELSGATRIVAVDLDGDGRPDLVATLGTRLVVSLNDGRGHFRPPVTLAYGDGPFTLGDFDSDGHVDVAFGNRSLGAVQIFSGRGDGTFSSSASLTTTGFISDLAAGDFDGDGATDLAVSLNALSVHVLFQRHGALSNATPPSFVNGYALTPIDLDRDGRIDLLVSYAQFGGSTLYNYRSLGDGSFSNFDAGVRGGGYHLGFTLGVGDLDGDGFPDVAVVNSGNGYPATLHVFHNEPGRFVETAVPALDRLSTSGVFFADFDGDGRQEIGVVVSDWGGTRPELIVLRSSGNLDVALFSRQSLPIAGAVAVTDVDGDGDADLILWQPYAVSAPILMRGACPGAGTPTLKSRPAPVLPRRSGALAFP